MRSLILSLVLVLGFAVNAFADITVSVLSYEKETFTDGRQPVIKVITAYYLDDKKVKSSYPDGNWRTRYTCDNFSKASVEADIIAHRNAIIKRYIAVNREAVLTKQEQIVDSLIVEQNGLPVDSPDKITNINCDANTLYFPNLDLTLPATGVIE